jgi:REP-associated tyrosine transposase
VTRLHRKSIRLPGYDYTSAGAYFVAMCTAGRELVFDQFPRLRRIAQEQWQALPTRFSTIALDAFVVMPNHIHLIVFLIDTSAPASAQDVAAPLAGARAPSPPAGHNVLLSETAGASPAATTTDLAAVSSVAAPLAGALSPAVPISPAGASPAPTLGTVVGAYKSLVSVAWLRFIKANDPSVNGRLWQPNYYERIIRNEGELNRIREYVQYNPTAWLHDHENPARKSDASHERRWAWLEDHKASQR